MRFSCDVLPFYWHKGSIYLSLHVCFLPDCDPDYPQFHIPSCTALQESALGNPWTCHVRANSISLKLISYFFIAVALYPCSPVNLLTPARFRIVYAFMFGSMSANLLTLISTGFININIDVIFLDVIFNTSKYTSLHINICVSLLAVSCNDYMHPSSTTFYISPSISFPPQLCLQPLLFFCCH